MNEDEWRVQVDLDDEQHGYDLGERLRSRDLDEEARKRLGGRVFVSRDGSRLFLYAAAEADAREAERVVRDLLAAENLTAEVALTRWHPVEETWKDASAPLPTTDDELDAERRQLEADERREAEDEGFDWVVNVHLPGRSEAAELATRLEDEGLNVHRRWRYLHIGALTEERANELAERVRQEAAPEAEIWVEATPDDMRTPVFVYVESRLRGS